MLQARSLWMSSALLLCATLPVAADALPRVPKNTPYAQARTILLGAGYQPVVNKEQVDCDPKSDQTCRPERVACAGTGLGQCIFAWRKGTTRIEIVTIGDRPIVNLMRSAR